MNLLKGWIKQGSFLILTNDENLKEIYQSIIIEHATSPRNFGTLDSKSAENRVYNPFCGDDITINLEISQDTIHQVSFYGDGCILCKASASMMTELIKNRKITQVQEISKSFVKMVTDFEDHQNFSDLGEAVAFQNVARFPVRVKCVLLPWTGLKNCLEGGKNG